MMTMTTSSSSRVKPAERAPAYVLLASDEALAALRDRLSGQS